VGEWASARRCGVGVLACELPGRPAWRCSIRAAGRRSNSQARTSARYEQRRIVAELDALQAEVEALKRLQAETSAELDALLPALLDRAFKGEL